MSEKETEIGGGERKGRGKQESDKKLKAIDSKQERKQVCERASDERTAERGRVRERGNEKEREIKKTEARKREREREKCNLKIKVSRKVRKCKYKLG